VVRGYGIIQFDGKVVVEHRGRNLTGRRSETPTAFARRVHIDELDDSMLFKEYRYSTDGVEPLLDNLCMSDISACWYSPRVLGGQEWFYFANGHIRSSLKSSKEIWATNSCLRLNPQGDRFEPPQGTQVFYFDCGSEAIEPDEKVLALVTALELTGLIDYKPELTCACEPKGHKFSDNDWRYVD
jgi:hypothetical protein